MGIAPAGSVFEDNSFFRETWVQDKGVARWSNVSVFGENSFYRETRSTTLGGWVGEVGGLGVDFWLNEVLTRRVAYPELKVEVRDLVRVVDIVAPFAPRGVSIRGKFVLLNPRW